MDYTPSYCPACGTYFDNWKGDGICFSCGFKMPEVQIPEPTPEKCEEHPKYEGIGAPKSDCLVCWKMHRGYVEGKIKELEAGKCGQA